MDRFSYTEVTAMPPVTDAFFLIFLIRLSRHFVYCTHDCTPPALAVARPERASFGSVRGTSAVRRVHDHEPSLFRQSRPQTQTACRVSAPRPPTHWPETESDAGVWGLRTGLRALVTADNGRGRRKVRRTRLRCRTAGLTPAPLSRPTP